MKKRMVIICFLVIGLFITTIPDSVLGNRSIITMDGITPSNTNNSSSVHLIEEALFVELDEISNVNLSYKFANLEETTSNLEIIFTFFVGITDIQLHIDNYPLKPLILDWSDDSQFLKLDLNFNGSEIKYINVTYKTECNANDENNDWFEFYYNTNARMTWKYPINKVVYEAVIDSEIEDYTIERLESDGFTIKTVNNTYHIKKTILNATYDDDFSITWDYEDNEEMKTIIILVLIGIIIFIIILIFAIRNKKKNENKGA